MLVLVSRLSRSLLACSSSTHLVFELRVDGGELLVERLQLLLGGLELLVARLELFVDGHQLFVGDPQLLIGALQLLDAALQILAGRLQLVLELAHERLVVLAWRARGSRHRDRGLVARTTPATGPSSSRELLEWLDRDLHALRGVMPRPHGRRHHRSLAVAEGLPDGAAQPGVQPDARLGDQVLRGHAGRLA